MPTWPLIFLFSVQNKVFLTNQSIFYLSLNAVAAGSHRHKACMYFIYNGQMVPIYFRLWFSTRILGVLLDPDPNPDVGFDGTTMNSFSVVDTHTGLFSEGFITFCLEFYEIFWLQSQFKAQLFCTFVFGVGQCPFKEVC